MKQHWADENELERHGRNYYNITTTFFFHIQGSNKGLPHVASQGLLISRYWVTIQNPKFTCDCVIVIPNI
jgi:hypothetical protein